MCKYSFGFLSRRSSHVLKNIRREIVALKHCRQSGGGVYDARKQRLMDYIAENMKSSATLTPAARQVVEVMVRSLNSDGTQCTNHVRMSTSGVKNPARKRVVRFAKV